MIPRGDPTLPAVPFHGEHQAGITTPKPPAGAFASFNVTAESRAELIDLLKTLTQTARFLATGGTPPAPTNYAPPADSGTLGPTVPADGLTVTVGFGSTLFDERFGLASRSRAAEADGAVPQRRPRSGPDRRRRADPAVRRQPRHDASRDAADHPRHARRAALNWRIEGFAAAAAADRRAAQHLRLQGRDRQPQRRRSGGREQAAVGDRRDRRTGLGDVAAATT